MSFEKIYQDNYEKISRYTYFRLHNIQDAEDIVSETFYKAYNAYANFDGQNVTAWLYRIAHNQIVNKYKSFENRNVIKNDKYLDYLESSIDIEKETMKKDEIQNLLNRLDLLEPNQKEAIILHYMNELEYAEIAQIMQKSENAIRSLVSRGIKALRKDMQNDKKLRLLAMIPIPGGFWDFKNTLFENIINMTNITNTTAVAAGTAKFLGSTFLATTAGKIVSGVVAVAVVAGAGTGVLLATNQKPKNNINNNTSITSQVSNTSTLTMTQTTTPIVTLTEDPKLNWKSYTNTKYGLSFKYPADWILTEREGNSTGTLITLQKGKYKIDLGVNDFYTTGGSVCAHQSKTKLNDSFYRIDYWGDFRESCPEDIKDGVLIEKVGDFYKKSMVVAYADSTSNSEYQGISIDKFNKSYKGIAEKIFVRMAYESEYQNNNELNKNNTKAPNDPELQENLRLMQEIFKTIEFK